SQSAISQKVSALEQDVGAALFIRSGRRVSLTREGAALLERAEALLADMESARRAIAAAQGRVAGDLRIASSLTIAGYVLPRPLTAFRRGNPDVRLTLRVRNTEDVVRALIGGDVDLGLVEGPVSSNRIELEHLFDDELAVIAPPDHRFAALDEIDLDDLLREPFVVREPGSGTRQVAEDALAAAGADPLALQVVAELSGIDAQKAVVEAGLGVSIVSTLTIRRELALGSLVARPVRGLTIRRELAAATVAGTPALPAARALVQALRAAGPRGQAQSRP
ncbi:MAG TPA: LysR substrate-binding domain-containing protein, partial [Gaiellaceae bacterium]|nr:LysR substrate-binding domain-containing protein [Gaiellaceae bacterium]